MPSIDNFINFKKKNFRSWDTDLLSKLKISDSHINDNKLESNISQIKDKHESNLSQPRVKLDSNISQIKDKHESNLSPNLSQNLSQTRDKLEPIKSNKNPIKNNLFLSLVGIQKNLTMYVYELCKLQREKITMPLSIENIASKANTTVSSARKALQRMEKKGIIIRVESKSGRGGWTRYELNESIYQEIIYHENLKDANNKIIENLSQTKVKLESEIETKLKSTSSSSSSLNRSTTRETEVHKPEVKNEKDNLPDEWENIDYSFLEDMGFNKNKLVQIYQAQKLTADMVQNSLLWYDFDRKKNDVKHNSPIALLMSLLKIKGVPYDMPSNYESPQELAMRRYVEQKQAQRERKIKLEESLKQTTFEEWLDTLSIETQETIVAKYGFPLNTRAGRGCLINYFDENIWEEKKNTILEAIK